MEITLVQGLLIALIAAIVGLDNALEGFFIFRPIIVAPLIGWALGDLNTGLLAGGLVELSFAGVTAVGGVTPPDAVITSIMTVVLAKTTGQPVAATFALAYPFGLLMQQVNMLIKTAFVFFNNVAERYVEERNYNGIKQIVVVSIIIQAAAFALVAFLSSYAAQDAMSTLVERMPEFIIHGFEVAGGLIPAVGFAMLLGVMLKGRFVPYLLAGFLFVSFIAMNNILPVALLGLIFAMIDFYNNSGKELSNDGKKGI